MTFCVDDTAVVDEWLLSGKAAEKEETDLTKLNGGLEDGD